MSAAVMSRVFAARKVPPEVKLVLLVLADNADEESRMCHMRRAQLRQIAGLTDRSLETALGKAQKLKLLDLDPLPGKGMVLAWSVGGL